MLRPETPGIDPQLTRALQVEVASLRDADLLDRQRRGRTPLIGDDDRQHTREIVQRVVTNHEGRLAESGRQPLTWEERQDLIGAIEARLFGAGSLQQLLEDPEVENIDINGHDRVFVEYADGRTAQIGAIALNDDELIENIQTLAAHDGLSARAFDVVNHAVNLRLADGSRLYAVQAVSDSGVLVSIRKHRYSQVTLKDLVTLETLDDEMADFLSAVVRAKKNIMIAGSTGAGKTTLLRALAAEISPSERLVTVERSLELGLHEDVARHPNCAALEERLANAEGVGGVSMAQLVRDSLRLNPSRVIVGEVLGDEVVTMLNAMMQGNDGSLSTIHANSSADVVAKVRTYALQAPERLPWEATSGLFAGAVDFVVFIRRSLKMGRQVRVIQSIREVAGIDEHGVKTNELFSVDERGSVSRQRLVQVACQDDLEAVGWVSSGSVEAADRRRWA